jgi:hypothetical protein
LAGSLHAARPNFSHSRKRTLPASAALCRYLCDIIVSCIDKRSNGAAYNISGQEKIDYIDLMREVKCACSARAAIVCVPYSLFRALLWTYGLFDRDPPFTTKQLKALVTPDVFEVIRLAWNFWCKANPTTQCPGTDVSASRILENRAGILAI